MNAIARPDETRQHHGQVPARTHLRDAMNHLANARRSVHAALVQMPDRRKPLQAVERVLTQLGRAVARQERAT